MNNLVIAFVVVIILIIFYYIYSKNTTSTQPSTVASTQPSTVASSTTSANAAVQSMSNALTTTLPTSTNTPNTSNTSNTSNALATAAAATTAAAAALTKTLPPVKPSPPTKLDIISKMCKTCDSTCAPGKCEYACPNGTGITSTLGYHLSNDPIYVVDYNNGNDSFQSGGNQYWFQGGYDSSENSNCTYDIGSIANCHQCNDGYIYCPYGTGVSSISGKHGPNDPVVLTSLTANPNDDRVIINGFILFIVDKPTSTSCITPQMGLKSFISEYAGIECNFIGSVNSDGSYKIIDQSTQQLMDTVPNPLFYCDAGFSGSSSDGFTEGDPLFVSTVQTDYSNQYYTAGDRIFWKVRPISSTYGAPIGSSLTIQNYNQDLDNKIMAQCYICGDEDYENNTYVCPNGVTETSANYKTGVKGNISSRMPMYLSDQQGTSEETFAIILPTASSRNPLWYQGPFDPKNPKTTCVKGKPML